MFNLYVHLFLYFWILILGELWFYTFLLLILFWLIYKNLETFLEKSHFHSFMLSLIESLVISWVNIVFKFLFICLFKLFMLYIVRDGQVAPIWSQLEPDPQSFDSLAWLDQFQQWSFSLDWLEFSWSQDWAHKIILMILLMFFRANFQKK